MGVPLGIGLGKLDMQAHHVVPVFQPGNELWLLPDSGNFMIRHACEIHPLVAGGGEKSFSR